MNLNDLFLKIVISFVDSKVLSERKTSNLSRMAVGHPLFDFFHKKMFS